MDCKLELDIFEEVQYSHQQSLKLQYIQSLIQLIIKNSRQLCFRSISQLIAAALKQ